MFAFVITQASREVRIAHRHFSHKPSTRYFLDLGNKIFECTKPAFSLIARVLPSGAPPSAPVNPLGEELNAVLTSLVEEPLELPPVIEPENAADREMENLSLLNVIHKRPSNATLTDFEETSVVNQTEFDLFRSEKLRNRIPDRIYTVVAAQRQALEAAKARQSEIEKIILEEKTGYDTAHEKLITQSVSLADEVSALEVDTPLAVYVPMGHGQSSLAHCALTQLASRLSPDADNIDMDTLKGKIMDQIRAEMVRLNISGQYGDILEKFTSVKARLMGDNPSALRRAFVNRLEEDMETLVNEGAAAVNRVAPAIDLPAELWAELDDAPGILERKIEELITAALAQVDAKVDGLNTITQKFIPTPLQNLLAENGIFTNTQFAYFEIRKQGDSYRLFVYPSAEDPSFYIGEHHSIHAPLVYNDLTAEQLNSEFFYRAFKYQAFLAEQGVDSYTLQHLKEGLLDPCLGKGNAGTLTNPVERSFRNQTLDTLEQTLVQQAVINDDQLNLSKDAFDKLILERSLDLKFAKFMKGWSYLYHNQDKALTLKNVQQMSKVIQTLASEVRRVKKILPGFENKFNRRVATLWHAAKLLRPLRLELEQQQQEQLTNLPDSQYIPKELREQIKSQVLNETVVHEIESIRDFFYDYFGAEADVALGQIVEEVLPGYRDVVLEPRSAEETTAAPLTGRLLRPSIEIDNSSLTSKISSTILQNVGCKSFFGLDELHLVKEHGIRLYQRVTLLNTFRLFKAVCDFANNSLIGVLSDLIISALLLSRFEAKTIKAFALKSLLDKAQRHGKDLLYAVLPKPIADAMNAILSVYSDIQSYFKMRIGMMIMRAGFRAVFSQQRELLVSRLHHVNAQISREGTLNFDVPLVVEATQEAPAMQVEVRTIEPSSPDAVEQPAQAVPVITRTAPALTTEFLLEQCNTILHHNIVNYYEEINLELSTINFEMLEFLIKYQRELSSGNHPEFLIAYFHIAAIIHSHTCHSARNAERYTDEFIDSIPYPNYEMLREWAESQQSTLSPLNQQRVATILDYFDQNASPNSRPWNSAEIMESRGPNGEPTEDVFSAWAAEEGINPVTPESTPKEHLNQILAVLFSGRDIPSEKHLALSIKSCYYYDTFFKNYKSQIKGHRKQEKAIFTPKVTELNEDNIHAELTQAINTAQKEKSQTELHKLFEAHRIGIFRRLDGKKLYSINNNSSVSDFHLHQLVRRMPIPIPGEPCMWDQVENPAEIIDQLYALMKLLPMNDNESIISYCALYTIAFHLARNVPECCLTEEERVDGSKFISLMDVGLFWQDQLSGATIRQSEELLRHFGKDTELHPSFFNGKTDHDLKKTELSNLSNMSTRFALPQDRPIERTPLPEKMLEYYSRVGNHPVTREKLNASLAPAAPLGDEAAGAITNTSQNNSPFSLVDYLFCSLYEPTDFSFDGTNSEQLQLYADIPIGASGERILPSSLRALREMEYLLHLRLETEYNFTPSADYKGESFTESLEINISRSSFLGISSETRNIDFKGHRPEEWDVNNSSKTPYPIRCRGTIEIPAIHIDSDYVRAFNYRGEEFLRLLEILKTDKLMLTSQSFSRMFFKDDLAISLNLKDNPELIHVFTKELLELIDSYPELYQGGDLKRHERLDIKFGVKKLSTLLLKIGQIAAENSPEGYEHLVNIRRELRNRILSYTPDKIKVAELTSLINSYRDDTKLIHLDADEKRIALADIAMGFVYLKDTLKPFLYWKPYLIEQMNKDPELLRMVMERIVGPALDASIIDPWTGHYPIYTDGNITVNLETLLIKEGRLHFSADSSIDLSETPLKAIYPHQTRTVAPTPPETAAPINEATASNVEPADIQIDLTEKPCGLGLLSWFQPLSDIIATVKSDRPDTVSKITFPKANLSFNVVEKEGKKRAYCENNYPGFFIAENQSLETSKIFSQSLLLENDLGEKKVVIIPHNFAQYALKLISKMLFNITTTAGIEGMIPSDIVDTLFTNASFNHPIACSIDSNGNLCPETTEGVAYLCAFYHVHGKPELSNHYLAELESHAKRGEFSSQTIAMLEILVPATLLGTTSALDQMGCRLATLLYTNSLIYSNNKAVGKRNHQSRLMLWLMAQKTYLSSRKNKATFPLDEHSELLLLKGLATESQTFIGKHIPDMMKGMLSWTGAEDLMEGMLLHPTISKRYAKLQAVLTDSRKGKLQYSLISWLNPKNDSSVPGTSQAPQVPTEGPGILKKAIELSRVVRENALKDREDLREKLLQSFKDFDFKGDLAAAPVDFVTIKGADFSRYFVMYLCFLTGLYDEENSTDEEKEAFRIKAELFKTTLSQAKGNYQKNLQPLINILKLVEWDTNALDELVNNEIYSEIAQNNVEHEESFLLDPTPINRYTFAHLNRLSAYLKERAVNAPAENEETPSVNPEAVIELSKFIERFQKISTLKIAGKLAFNRNIISAVSSTVINTVKNKMPQEIKANLGIQDDSAAEQANEFKRMLPQNVNAAINLATPFVNQAAQSAFGWSALKTKCAIASLKSCITAIQMVPSAFRTARSLFRSNQKINAKKAARRASKEQANETSRQMINPELAATLQLRDKNMNATFKYLRNKYFQAEDVSADAPEAPEPLFDELTGPGEAYEKLHQSHRDYYNNRTIDGTVYSFDGKRNDFLNEVDQIRKATKERNQAERKNIVDFVNAKRFVTTEGQPHQIEDFFTTTENKSRVFSYEDILAAVLKGELQNLKASTQMSDDDIELVKKAVLLHLVDCTRWDAFFKAFDETASSPSATDFDRLGKVLASKRAYKFAGKQERAIMGFLAFEAGTGMVLWKKQVELFERMVTHAGNRVVLELIMGSGKTAFGLPFASYFAANKQQLVVNIWPKPTAPTNIEETSQQSKKVYFQTAWAFTFGRASDVSLHTLQALYIAWTGAIVKGEQLNMTKEDVQALQLNHDELFWSERALLPEEKQKLEYYQKLLRILSEAKAHIDEAHINFAQNIELNFPLGAKKHLSKDVCATMEEAFKWLVKLDIPALTPFKTPGEILHSIEEDYFKENISPLLYEKACERFAILPEHREDFINFLSNQIPAPSYLKSREDYQEICLIKGMCQVLLPMGFNSIPQVNYCVSNNGVDEFARPAEGNSTPNENSTIQSPYEAYVKTCILYLKNRLSETQIKRLILHYRNLALNSAKSANIPQEQTREAKFFAKITTRRDAEGRKIKGNLFSDATLTDQAILELLKNNDAFTLAYVRHCIGPNIDFFAKKCSSNSHDFASMFGSFAACTGTPDNFETYAEFTDLILDPGTQGESIAIIDKKCGKENIPILRSKNAENLVDEVLNTFFQPGSDYYSIEERGALFRGLKNEFVAKKMLDFAQEIITDPNGNQTARRPDIHAVIFWDADNNPMVLEKGSNKPTPYKNCRLQPEQCWTYFDESHTYAANIPQPCTSKGVVTFGEHTRLDGGFQAIWRQRKLREGQGFTFVTSEPVYSIMGVENVTPIEVVKFFARNTDAFTRKENYENAPKVILNILKQAIRTKILRSKNPAALRAELQPHRDLFMLSISNLPSQLFAAMSRDGTPRESLEQYINSLRPVLNSAIFTHRERAELLERMNAHLTGNYPETVKVYEGSGVNLFEGNQQMNVQGAANTETADETEAAQQQQNDQQTNVNHFTAIYRHKPWYWSENLDIYNLNDWLAVTEPQGNRKTKVPVFSVRDVCTEELDFAVPSLSPEILMTNNFTPIRSKFGFSSTRSAFDRVQGKTRQLLIVQDGTDRKLLLLDSEEAERIRNILRKRPTQEQLDTNIRFALYDLTVGAIVATRHNPIAQSELDESESFQKALVQIKFMNGYVRYNKTERSALKKWLREMPIAKARDWMEGFFRYKSPTTAAKQYRDGHYAGSKLQAFLDRRAGTP